MWRKWRVHLAFPLERSMKAANCSNRIQDGPFLLLMLCRQYPLWLFCHLKTALSGVQGSKRVLSGQPTFPFEICACSMTVSLPVTLLIWIKLLINRCTDHHVIQNANILGIESRKGVWYIIGNILLLKSFILRVLFQQRFHNYFYWNHKNFFFYHFMEKKKWSHEMTVTLDYIQQWEKRVTGVASTGQHCLVLTH